MSSGSTAPRGSLAALAASLLLVTIYVSTAEGRARIATMLRMESLGNCEEYSDLRDGFISSEVFPMGKTLYGRGVWQFNNSYSKLTKVVALIKKCVDRNDPHCEVFQNWRFGEETCNLLTMKNMLWTPLFNYDPPITCPIKKGNYRLENATLDIEKMKLINFPEKGYWKVNIMIEADKVPRSSCYHFEVSFIKVRV